MPDRKRHLGHRQTTLGQQLLRPVHALLDDIAAEGAARDLLKRCREIART